jgi:hypothetical protein
VNRYASLASMEAGMVQGLPALGLAVCVQYRPRALWTRMACRLAARRGSWRDLSCRTPMNSCGVSTNTSTCWLSMARVICLLKALE